MSIGIVFQIDTSVLSSNTTTTDYGSHPPYKCGQGFDVSKYQYVENGDQAVTVPPNTEVYIWLQDKNNDPKSVFCPTGFGGIKWNGSDFNESLFEGGDKVISVAFTDQRNDLYDYVYDAMNPTWTKDGADGGYWHIDNTASLKNPKPAQPYIVVSTMFPTGTLTYGIEFKYAYNGKEIGSYWFDPKITIAK